MCCGVRRGAPQGHVSVSGGSAGRKCWAYDPVNAWSTANWNAVTDLQGPPSERTPEEKLWDFKTRAQQYARDRGSCDDVWISYLEFLETEAEDDLALARMIAG
jgi:hypothetical protein